ncbi:hypothetical protein [Joostella sp. CR20]|uniref:hypothetical protein n=1 Tax=Joostella sp. CR20 TaxID=2804312 RepID=UPI00313DD816
MLDTTSQEKLSKLLGIDQKNLLEILKSDEEKSLLIPEGELFTEDQLTKRDGSKYNEGKEAGVEMLVKELKKEHSYDFEGKDVKAFLNHHNEQLKTKYSKGNNEKVIELEADLKKQKEAFEKELGALKTEKENLTTTLRTQKVRNQLLGIMPKETTIKSDAIITLFNSEHQIIEEDGKVFVTKNGQKLKDDKTQEPLTIDSVFTEYVAKEGFAKGVSGRGGGNEPGGSNPYAGIKTPQDFQEKWKKENPNASVTSSKYDEDYQAFRQSQKEA